MMMAKAQEVEEMEYLVKEKLYEYTLPQGNVEKTIDTGVTWGELKKYKRFSLGVYPKANSSLSNWYAYIGKNILSRFTGSGVYIEIRNEGAVLEAIFSAGNGVVFYPSYIERDNNESIYHTASSSRYLVDSSTYSDDDSIIFKVPTTSSGAPTEYTFWVCGLTKKA